MLFQNTKETAMKEISEHSNTQKVGIDKVGTETMHTCSNICEQFKKNMEVTSDK